MNDLNGEKIRKVVRENYARVASSGKGCCGSAPAETVRLPTAGSSCCGSSVQTPAELPAQDSTRMGYSSEEISSVPEGADMGLGCGNPQAIAALQSGEVVLDLGCGGGFDCFLAAKQVGNEGKVIGVDMTPEMISKARENAEKSGFSNIEFRLGEIEHLPAADNSVDVILSNCVINLSPDKFAVYSEAFRVLKPGGRLAISDMVSTAELPEDLRQDLDYYCGCITGAISVDELESILNRAGFINVRIEPKDESREFVREWVPGRNIEDCVVSATIEATKPA
ncbi:MAG: arsenite methyltransferase [Dehalococcoidia bacterium]